MNQQISTKRLAISKANAQMVGIVAVAAFVTVFCLVASKAVFSQNRYQARVISAKEKAHKQLQDNINNYNNLAKAYKSFRCAPRPTSSAAAKTALAIMTAPTPRLSWTPCRIL